MNKLTIPIVLATMEREKEKLINTLNKLKYNLSQKSNPDNHGCLKYEIELYERRIKAKESDIQDWLEYEKSLSAWVSG